MQLYSSAGNLKRNLSSLSLYDTVLHGDYDTVLHGGLSKARHWPALRLQANLNLSVRKALNSVLLR